MTKNFRYALMGIFVLSFVNATHAAAFDFELCKVTGKGSGHASQWSCREGVDELVPISDENLTSEKAKAFRVSVHNLPYKPVKWAALAEYVALGEIRQQGLSAADVMSVKFDDLGWHPGGDFLHCEDLEAPHLHVTVRLRLRQKETPSIHVVLPNPKLTQLGRTHERYCSSTTKSSD